MNKNSARIILIISVLVSFVCGALGAYVVMGNTSTNNIIVNVGNNDVKYGEESSLALSVLRVYDAVVVVEGIYNDSLASTGTGFIYKQVNDTFYIMTNHHVISGMNKVRVILSDDTVVDAIVRGSEAYSDIAVLAIKSNKVKNVALLGDSSKSKVGDTLFTVGSPEGADYAGTVTKGILSGRDRLVAVALNNDTVSDYYLKVLQTDAAINPGNSGGPICNTNGEVIGITNMKLVDSTVEGMGFAIPIEDALLYAKVLESGKSITRPYIGIGMSDLSSNYALWQSGIIIPSDIDKGVVITQVVSHSPADVAKLKKGDIILSFGGIKIKSIAEFRYQLYKHAVGEEVEVEYYRDGKVKSTKIKLTENRQ